RRRLKILKRDLWWNPQRHLPDGPPEARSARAEKIRWIESRATSSDESRERYETLRKLNAELRPFVKTESDQVAKRMEEGRHELGARQVQGRRDYAFCLYPEAVIRPFCQ